MIEIYDLRRNKVAAAENALAVSETKRLNSINSLSFTLPANDPKNEFCNPYWYVRSNGGDLYRIMPNSMKFDDDKGLCEYQCEHVLATLIDKIMYDWHVATGTTAECIQYVLGHQQNWVLADCDFQSRFEYGWQNETLLQALFSIATPFATPYIWRTDTSVYPWRLSLKRLQTTGPPEIYIRYSHNMTALQSSSDPQHICTRLYPLGYGEGVNQLDIRTINGGLPYLQSPADIVAKYGIVERVWIDRRYTDPASLKASAAALLEELQKPLVSYDIGAIEGGDPGTRVRIIYPNSDEWVDTYITEVTRGYDSASVTVSNRPTSIAESIADLADKQRIEQAYAQGATQVYAQALQINCAQNHGAVMDFFIPEEMKIINKVIAKVRIDKFRAYSKATTTVSKDSYTDDIVWNTDKVTEDKDVEIVSSEAGGVNGKLKEAYAYPSDSPYGYKVYTGTAKAKYGYAPMKYFDEEEGVWKDCGDYSKEVPAHNHPFDPKTHNHGKFTYPAHHHTYTIPGHYHKMTLPAHRHEIQPGIYRFGNPQSFSVYINGTQKGTFATKTAEIDITSFLIGVDGKIPRGQWFTLEIRPDSLTYASIVLVVQGFIQSRGGIIA